MGLFGSSFGLEFGSGQSTVGGPKWTKMDLVPFWSILLSRMLKMSVRALSKGGLNPG